MKPEFREKAERALQSAIKKVGGPTKVGNLYDPPIKRQAVDKWLVCPAARVPALAEASGVAASDLRPDIYK